MNILNQFSFVVLATVLGLIIFVVINRIPQLNLAMQLVIIAVYFSVALFVGRSFQYPDSPVVVETIEDVENTLINENSTFVMLYSNY